ncbi:MAG: hypothetical protein AAGF12_19560, partial [Myxococcota bacterium]
MTLVWLAIVVPATTALAQTDEERARARDSYARGQELFRAGEYDEAEAAFNDAYDAIPNPIVLLGIA